MSKGECLYCGEMVENPEVIPAIDDDAAWSVLAKEHHADCEWIATRAHRIEEVR